MEMTIQTPKFAGNNGRGKRLEKIEGLMGERRIPHKRKGKVLNSCFTPAYMYSLETMALTEKHQEKWQIRGMVRNERRT